MNGVIIVDKPAGFTSFDVIAKLRGILKERKLGHGGTLDPMATGVLPVFIGQATKAADIMPCTDKRYVAVVQLGVATDTGDRDGNVIESSGTICEESALRDAIAQYTGTIKQVPPMYSAIKINGKRLYQMARAGEVVERQPRTVKIHALELLQFDADRRQFTIDVHCSKGTYIRTLAEDIARAAGCPACLYALRRTMSAGFEQKHANTLAHIEQCMQSGTISEILLPVEQLFKKYQRIQLDEKLQCLFLNGVTFEAARTGQTIDEKTVATVYGGAVFLGLAVIENGFLRKTKQFFIEPTK